MGAGLRELAEVREDEDASGPLRSLGAGRESLVFMTGLGGGTGEACRPATRGDPMGPLRRGLGERGRRARQGGVRGGDVAVLVVRMGCVTHPAARRLSITADGGGCGGIRSRLCCRTGRGFGSWVCHSPPRTSKWNKMEHRMFCHITRTGGGRW